MSLNFTIEQGGSTVPAGAYRAKFVGVEDFDHEEYGAGLKFIFKVTGGQHDGEEATRITSPKPTPQTACGRMIAGILGVGLTPGQSVDLSPCVGQEYLINVAETKSGSTRVESVIRANV